MTLRKTLSVLCLVLLLGASAASVTDLTWAYKTPLPAIVGKNVALAGPDGKIYSFAGGNAGGHIRATQVYDPETDTSYLVAPQPTTHGGHAMGAASGGKMYLIGGYEAGVLAVNEEYDPVTDTWATKTPMPTARYGAGAAATPDGRIWVAGGHNIVSLFNKLEVYVPATDTWATRAPMPSYRANLAAVALNGKLYVIGGSTASQDATGLVEEYDPETDTWATKASLNIPRNFHAAVVASNGRIYVCGGSYLDRPRWVQIPIDSVEEYDPVADAWTIVTNLPVPLMVMGAAAPTDGKFYLLGGGNGFNGALLVNTVLEATIASPNQPPVARAGADMTAQCTNAAGTPVALDGATSSDPDNDPLTYTWTGPFPEGDGVVTGATPVVTLPLGPSTITLTVADGQISSAPDTVVVTVTLGVEGLLPPLGALVPEGGTVTLPDKAFKQGRTLPLRLWLLCGGTPVCGPGVAPPRIVGLQRSGDAIDLDTLDIDAGYANDAGLDFRATDDNWTYNLKTSTLPSGIYVITIQMPDGQRWIAGFVLR